MNQVSHATVIVKDSDKFVEFYYGKVLERAEKHIELELQDGTTRSFNLSGLVAGNMDTVDLDDEGEVIAIESLI